MTQTEHIKGIGGLAAIWISWFIANLPTIQMGVSILASLAAFIASIIYARYYWMKTKKEKK